MSDGPALEFVAVWAASHEARTCAGCGGRVQVFRSCGLGKIEKINMGARSRNSRGADGRLVQLFFASDRHVCKRGGR